MFNFQCFSRASQELEIVYPHFPLWVVFPGQIISHVMHHGFPFCWGTTRHHGSPWPWHVMEEVVLLVTWATGDNVGMRKQTTTLMRHCGDIFKLKKKKSVLGCSISEKKLGGYVESRHFSRFFSQTKFSIKNSLYGKFLTSHTRKLWSSHAKDLRSRLENPVEELLMTLWTPSVPTGRRHNKPWLISGLTHSIPQHSIIICISKVLCKVLYTNG